MLGLNADQIGTILLAVSLTIVSLMGGRKGREMVKGAGPAPAAGIVEVAGAIVSDKAVTEWVKSANENTAAVMVLAKSIDKNTEACRDAASSAKDASDAMEVLTREIIRKH